MVSIGIAIALGLVILLLASPRVRLWARRHPKKVLIFGLVLLAGLIGISLFLAAGDHLAIDRCLDRGGRWNHEAKTCEM